MVLKRVWQLHSWLGLFCGAGLLVIGLTGSLLVFHDEIEALIHPQMLAVTPTPAGRLPLDSLVSVMRRALPDYEVTYWIIRPEPQWADVAYVVRHGETKVRVASIDPYRAEIRAAPIDTNSTFTGWMLNLHYTFFAGPIGVAFAGILAVALCLLGLSGFWIYRGFWKHFFRLRFGKSARILFSDTHKMIGITSMFFNLLLGFTGAYWNLTEVIGDIRNRRAPEPPPASKHFYSESLSIDRLILEATKRLPDFRASYVSLPIQASGFIVIAGRVPTHNPIRSEYGSSVAFDPQTGEVKQVVDVRRAGLWTQIVDTFVPLHFGTFGGLPIKILWTIGGLAPGTLALSGFLIWRSRRRRISMP